MIIPLPVTGCRAWLIRLRTDSHNEATYGPWFSCKGGVQTALNAMLINHADRWVLIDTGGFDTEDSLAKALGAAGCVGDSVTDVVLTGSIADKVGGAGLFARAVVSVAAAHPVEVAPGITVEPAPGPVPEHGVVTVECGNSRLVHLGDLVVHSVQMNEPDIPSQNDFDPEQAALSRRTILTRLADSGALTVGSRLPGPGFVGRTSHAFGWSPVLF